MNVCFAKKWVKICVFENRMLKKQVTFIFLLFYNRIIQIEHNIDVTVMLLLLIFTVCLYVNLYVKMCVNKREIMYTF